MTTAPQPPPGKADALRESWDRHPARHLDTYLVSGREDPRINPQSILNRALLTDTLWPGKFDELIGAELVFGGTLTGLLAAIEDGATREDLLAALPGDAPDYAADALTLPPDPGADGGAPFPSAVLDQFIIRWGRELAGLVAPPTTVVEAACGSANDFRFFHTAGLDRAIDYTGFDISPKNISNALRRFPGNRFVVADACAPPFADGEFDFLFAHDLFEHLSPEGLEAALAGVVRVTRRQAWLHFFNLADGPEHEINPVGGYHWNRLSETLVVASLRRAGAAQVDVVRIPELLAAKAPGLPTYANAEAATLIVTLPGAGDEQP